MDIEILKKIGEEMISQDNRMAQFPLFVVQEDVLTYVGYSGNWDTRQRAEEIEDDDLCENCSELWENGGDMPDDCDDCDIGAFNYFMVERRMNDDPGVFFTAKACEEHIEANHYRYNNPKCYGIYAWRNPEMAAVMQYLCSLAGEVPKHYQ